MMVHFDKVPTREVQGMMTETKKQSRKKDSTKKIVSLTIDPILIEKIDGYAASKKISRSAAIEFSITGLLALNSDSASAVPENSLVQPEESIFASPQLGTAIHF